MRGNITARFVNHSGGCPGADMTWELIGKEFGVRTIAYSFYNHVQYGENPYIMNAEELREGYQKVLLAAKTIKRPVEQQAPYIKNLLSRNWFQVKHSTRILAIGRFANSSYTTVDGGTGWAVQMAIDANKEVYVFDQKSNAWYMYAYNLQKFSPSADIPTLTSNFAGIGTREISDAGILAIREVYEHTLKGDL